MVTNPSGKGELRNHSFGQFWFILDKYFTDFGQFWLKFRSFFSNFLRFDEVFLTDINLFTRGSYLLNSQTLIFRS